MPSAGETHFPTTSSPLSTPAADNGPITSPTATPSRATPSPSTVQPATNPPTTRPPTSSRPTNRPTYTNNVASTAYSGTEPHDRCELAYGPLQVTSTGSTARNQFTTTIIGSTAQASKPEQPMESCNGVRSTSAAVWHTVVGTGGRMSASTCWAGTNYDTKVTVFGSGQNGSDGADTEELNNDCTSLTCITANDDSVRGGRHSEICHENALASRVAWESQEGELYKIMIHGFANRVGQYELSVQALNDRCSFAAPLSVGDTVIGNTEEAGGLPFDGKIGNCRSQGTVGGNPGLFYKVEGTGQRMEISSCNPGTQIVTKIHVFEGNCHGLDTCIAGESTPNGCSTLQWETEPFVEYYVLAHGHIPTIGTFELSLSFVE